MLANQWRSSISLSQFCLFLFDVEVIFFYPYAVNFREFAADPLMGWHTFGALVMFVALFLAGFIYIIKKGALKWED